ncbi:putative glycolipid-binding domain-containing protein [Streptomyces tropicalis]|uniref:Glycolipid-binding domain-containing protein n=1 Tax=Streptomyces tropicalis TaxID=3034234 RepID=A0ABT6ADK7_9ACTN|nr:putative glycolipid-binding domain-containing protein [Streptomyces tropicalis]MDF3302740.1 putative glycolipid-binding domain-containing protein [Streptomyces tropicalis]
MPTTRVITWDVTAGRGYGTAWIEFGRRSLRAHGRAVATAPEPYWVDYALETAEDWVTRRLLVTVASAGPTRSLDLRHDGSGGWTANGAPLPEVTGALDCDLGLCPLTNTMPVLRHGLHRGPGEREFLMAWVSVPDLAVLPSRQTYTHLARTDRGARVRYASGGFTSDLEIDADGCVADYPQLATRLGA